MKVLRVRHGDKSFYGQLLLDEKAVRCLDRDLGLTELIPLAELAILPPVTPSKVVCAAANFRDRLQEMGRTEPDAPMLFLKPPSAIIASGQAIVLPRIATRVEAFGTLAMVLGRSCRNVAPGDVPRYLFGCTCANDVTAGDLGDRDETFGRAKGFDTFFPIGPWIETDVPDPPALPFRTRINGRLVREGSTADMVLAPMALVSFISTVMTLLPGDVVLTGSPAGGSVLTAGDEVRVEIDGVGVLINPVRAEAAPLQ